MRPLSIVMVSAGFWPSIGGAESQALELSAALVSRGHRVTVLTRRVGGLPERETIRGVFVRRLPAPAGILDAPVFLAAGLFWLMLHWVEWDSVHAHLAGSPALAAACAGRLLGRPALVKLGGGRGIGEIAASSKTRLGRAKLRALRFLRPKFLAVARDLAEEAREFMGNVLIEILPNGVDTGRFHPVDAAAKSALRRGLGWPDDAIVFLYMGRFSKEKRLPWFLRQWRQAVVKRSLVVLVGEGPEKAAIEAEAAQNLSRVKVLPPRDDIAGLYAAADVFVLPSLSEGLSNALLEAMSSGLAPLASRVGGTIEAVSDGREGLLFNRDDEPALKAAMQRLESEPGLASRLGAASRAKVEKLYAMGRVISRLEELYLAG